MGALLGLAVEIKLGSPRRHHLGFLGVRDFSNQWNERFASPADLRLALDKTDLSMFLKSKGVTFVAQQQRFEVIVAELEGSLPQLSTVRRASEVRITPTKRYVASRGRSTAI